MGTTSSEATQLIYLRIPPNLSVKPTADNGFREALDILKGQPGYKRMYWGRRPEIPDLVQLHVVRDTMQQHHNFLKSPEFLNFKQSISKLVTKDPEFRHAQIHEYLPGCLSLGKGAPLTGTGVHLGITPEWNEAYGSTWADIVCHVPGFMGIAGGHIEEEVNGQKAYIALVGWENSHVHDAYHLTRHFRRNAHILLRGNTGYQEYGHIAFKYKL